MGAQERAELVRKAWEDADCPLTVRHSNGTAGIHPLLRVLTDCEEHAEKLRRPLLRRGNAGPRSFLDVAAEENRIRDGLSPAAALRLIGNPKPSQIGPARFTLSGMKEPASAAVRRRARDGDAA